MTTLKTAILHHSLAISFVYTIIQISPLPIHGTVKTFFLESITLNISMLFCDKGFKVFKVAIPVCSIKMCNKIVFFQVMLDV